MEAFATDSGVWNINNGTLRVSAEMHWLPCGRDTAGLLRDLRVTITMEKPTAGWKANLIDINDSDNPISVAGNLTLLISLTDSEESETLDSIGITLWNGNKLWFSSNWAGTKSIEQLLAKGNIAVHN